MKTRDLRIASAILDRADAGRIELTSDWIGRGRPRIRLAEKPHELAQLLPVPDHHFGLEAGFFVDRKGVLCFCFDPAQHPDFDWRETPVFVAGTFNGWPAAVGQDEWRLKPQQIDGREILTWRGRAAPLLTEPNQQFKFVSLQHHWFEVPSTAPNAVLDDHNRNYAITTHRTGRHRFTFTLPHALDLSLEHAMILTVGGVDHATDLQPGEFFFQLRSDQPLGAIIEGGTTVFRLFAPRARRVRLAVFADPGKTESLDWRDLERQPDHTWELRIDADLHGWYYWYRVEGPGGRFSGFEPGVNILDPYALATVDRDGPGIVLDPARLARRASYFKPPPWQDLVICEAHVRDLLAHSPIIVDPVEKRTFGGLTRWLLHRNCYFKKLGVNAVELQPVQEFDNRTPEEYGWGYMPVNFFAPESSYGRDPARASAVVELQELVETFHREGFAVILDVVYNHVGEPNHLHLIDRLYYFETAPDGSLLNWSGCGNDLRTRSAMTRRLIIDSLLHLVRYYGVDGFRFDLAELVGLDALREIEAALKRVKPDVILIAEPWSFRGHIAAALRDTGYASWNDGYRNFLRDYVRGHGSAEAAAYFLRGSPWHFARWPAQTINYTESHDDRTWIDGITENPGYDGRTPTVNDIRRTHLMAAFLFASIGIPMLHAGQDALGTKNGVNNTYQQPDLNALDYRRPYRYPGTHAYFADWIRFRRGPWGILFRHFSRPTEGFLEFHFGDGHNAFAAIYNANGSLGPMRLLLALNPHLQDITIPLGHHAALPWRQVADHERFFRDGEADEDGLIDAEGVFVPALGCGLWTAGG